MIKNNKRNLILSSIVILLPVIAGLLLWNILPDSMTTHWGADGAADGWSGKAFAVFGLPLILLAMHWFCIFVTAAAPKNKNQNRKAFGMVLWIIPVVSLFSNAFVYAVALGMDIHPDFFISAVIGLMFIILGNYLPKCRQNNTIGIKISWTLNNEENWNLTHRLAGKLWVAGGVILLFAALLPETVMIWVWVVTLIVLAGVPMIYSYVLHRRMTRTNDEIIETVTQPVSTFNKWATRISLVFAAVLLLFVGIMMFTGDVEIQYNETSFTIEASYWNDLTVDYAAVDHIEYRENDTPGSRVAGFGSPRLGMGNFHNDEFGMYTRYSYTQCDSCVVLTSGDKVLVLTGKDAKDTKAIYDELSARIYR